MTFTPRAGSCKICGRAFTTQTDLRLHERACEEAAQNEIRAHKYACELAAIAQAEQCDRCGRVHVFSSEEESCNKEFHNDQIEMLDALEENRQYLRERSFHR